MVSSDVLANLPLQPSEAEDTANVVFSVLARKPAHLLNHANIVDDLVPARRRAILK